MRFTKETKILITGCGGMLGDAFFRHYSKLCNVLATDINLNEDWLQFLDVRNKDEIQAICSKFQPDMIFHLAALTDLEYCEENQNDAYLTNAIGTENVANISLEMDIPMLYISTAGIFDGTKEYYDDWDIPNPINHYGRAKWAGEMYIRENLSKYFVCRAGWMMGAGPRKDKKFVKKIIDQIHDNKTELNVVDDKLGTPTYTYKFAENTHLLIESGNYGVYNMVCDDDCSRFDVATEIVSAMGLSEKIKINRVDSGFFKTEYYAPRPASEKLLSKKLKLRGIYRMGNWKENLHDYINNHFK